MAPEWNPHARAAWFGLTAAHGRAHLTRALVEGNALALRDVIEAIAGTGADAPREVVCVGGGARGRLLLQVRASVTGLPVSRPEDVETTARGAAMLAAAGAGLHPSVAAAARAMAGPAAGGASPTRASAPSMTSSTGATAGSTRPCARSSRRLVPSAWPATTSRRLARRFPR